jgi:hypothetical protein
MGPTALAESPEQDLIIRLQEEDADGMSALPQGGQDLV